MPLHYIRDALLEEEDHRHSDILTLSGSEAMLKAIALEYHSSLTGEHCSALEKKEASPERLPALAMFYDIPV